jgi:hypothetical protein
MFGKRGAPIGNKNAQGSHLGSGRSLLANHGGKIGMLAGGAGGAYALGKAGATLGHAAGSAFTGLLSVGTAATTGDPKKSEDMLNADAAGTLGSVLGGAIAGTVGFGAGSVVGGGVGKIAGRVARKSKKK